MGRPRRGNVEAMLDLGAVRVLARSGLLAPVRPDRVLGMAASLARWRLTLATAVGASAARFPQRVALVDDAGALTYRELDRRTDALAGHLRERGVREGDAVGLLARNGRGFLEPAVALAKCGADVLYLGTGTAADHLRQVLDRERAVLTVHDAEFGGVLGRELGRQGVTTEELDTVAETPSPCTPRRASRTSRQVILTSGTTGAPRGTARGGARLDDAVAVLSAIPIRAGGTTLVASPAYHAWGLGTTTLSLVLGSTVVLHRTFDAERVLRDVQERRVTDLVVVPVLLDKLLQAHPERYDTSSLRVIASSGGALPGDLVQRAQAAFGPVLHNLYGSTEVAYAAVATPADLAADPRTAGRPPQGVTLRVVDDEGRDVAQGEAGRVFVGNGMAFAGYTDGTDKARLGDLVATGDLGSFDAAGRLTVLGRDDDMVVVGGENVFTTAVEDALLHHSAVRDAAVVDVPDTSYGVRLVAHVVLDRPVPDRELQDWVRDRVARAAVPREVRVVDELPRNATGKVLKRELRATLQEHGA